MTDMLRIRSKDDLFEEIVVEGLKEHVSGNDIRLALIDAMRKEIFGQMAWRMKVDDPREAMQTPKNEEIVKNIAIQARKKWEALIKMCGKYRETANLIGPNDLQEIWNGEEEVPGGEWDGDEMTAEWPELSVKA